MGLDLDALADLLGDSVFQFARDAMRLAKRHRAVDLEVERDALAPPDMLDGDVVHRQAPARRDHQHALEDRFIIERERIGGDGHVRLRPAPHDAPVEVGFDRAHPFERQGAGDGDDDVAGNLGAARAEPDRVDRRDAARVCDEPRTASVRPTGARSTSASIVVRPRRKPAAPMNGDADGGERIGVGVARARRGKPDQHQHGRDRDRSRNAAHRPPSAWLDVSRATWASARQRTRSTAIENTTAPIAKALALTSFARADVRSRMATPTASANRNRSGERGHRLDLGVAEGCSASAGLSAARTA